MHQFKAGTIFLTKTFAADGGEGRTGREMGVSWSVGGLGFSTDRPVSSCGNSMASSLTRVVGCNLTHRWREVGGGSVSAGLCGSVCGDAFRCMWVSYSIVDPVRSFILSLSCSTSSLPLSISRSSSPGISSSLCTSKSRRG